MKKHLLVSIFILTLAHAAHTQSATILPNTSSFSNNIGDFTNNSTSSGAYGISAIMTSTTQGNSSAAVRGINNGTGIQGIGVWGSHAGSGVGLLGSSPNGIAVHGSSVNGIAVFANASSGGTGVFASANTGTGLISSSSNGIGAQISISNASNSNFALQVSTVGAGIAAEISKTGTSGNGAGLVVKKLTPYSGAYTPNPHADLEVRHPLSQTGTGMTGLRIFNTGGNNNNWTFYTNDISGALSLFCNGVSKGTFASSNGAYTATSDMRLKNNIQPYASTLDKLMKIGVKSYKLHHSDKTEVGLLAQEVLQYFPEIVYNNTNDNGEQFYSMDYSRVGVLAVSAIQEQQKQIDEQKSLINEQKTLIEALTKEMAELKAMIKK